MQHSRPCSCQCPGLFITCQPCGIVEHGLGSSQISRKFLPTQRPRRGRFHRLTKGEKRKGNKPQSLTAEEREHFQILNFRQSVTNQKLTSSATAIFHLAGQQKHKAHAGNKVKMRRNVKTWPKLRYQYRNVRAQEMLRAVASHTAALTSLFS